ncbi:PREDICTED: uncharacterized protein LOC106115258 isoform X1 [Papilio xuthus]|uniref:Uncharacterized protein LOC106115258 isoform X1 n=2 Tax=Papilio xuthus TaxID=66420 RepID=A0AAJ6Z2B8_PAPXU|nr:PREDICTED: uncharacterized protein LOC106115258 isoform X1 [Papilio xuthus]
MLMDWGNLPLLPLGCVLRYLRTKDALAASSVCRHWRSALLIVGARMDTLKLRVSNIDRSCFLTRVFRKQVKQIYIYIDSSSEDLQLFMSNVFTQFYEMKMIKEVTFIGPIYLQEESYSPVFMLKRQTLESLPFNNLDSLLLMGCTLSPLESIEEDEHTCLEKECDPLALTFNNVFTPAKDVNLDSATSALSMLQNLTIEYDCLSSEVVACLSHLKHFKYLNINITNKTNLNRKPLDWSDFKDLYPNGLNVCINMICVPESKFNKVMTNVLVEELPLTSIKVMFCKTLHLPMIKQLTTHYKKSLRELVWVDSPFHPIDDREILKSELRDDSYAMFNMNPLVLLCWQCNQLQRLVLHGYWIWHYDLVGCVRLRCLEQLDVSAVEVRETHYLRLRGGAPGHVLTTDTHDNIGREILHHINKYMNVKWRPRSWRKLHRAVRGQATHEDRVDYMLQEAKQTYSIM